MELHRVWVEAELATECGWGRLWLPRVSSCREAADSFRLASWVIEHDFAWPKVSAGGHEDLQTTTTRVSSAACHASCFDQDQFYAMAMGSGIVLGSLPRRRSRISANVFGTARPGYYKHPGRVETTIRADVRAARAQYEGLDDWGDGTWQSNPHWHR